MRDLVGYYLGERQMGTQIARTYPRAHHVALASFIQIALFLRTPCLFCCTGFFRPLAAACSVPRCCLQVPCVGFDGTVP